MSENKHIESAASYKSARGFIAILDALGSSQHNIESSRSFLSSRDEIIKTSLEFAEQVDSKIKNKASDNDKNESTLAVYPTTVIPVIFTFGDTLIITLECTENRFLISLYAFSLWLSRFLAAAYAARLKFRGAISYGDFISDQHSSVIGPAVAQSALWYESHDLIGAVFEPNLNIQMLVKEETYPGRVKGMASDTILKYSVPIKPNGTRELWTINWPMTFKRLIEKAQLSKKGFKTHRALFLNILGLETIPRDASRKVEEIIHYYDFATGCGETPPER